MGEIYLFFNKKIIIAAIVLLLCACEQKQEVISPTGTQEAQVENNILIEDRLSVQRAIVAKMVALTYNDLPSVKAMDREISFKDSDSGKWFDKYINTVRVQKYMMGDGDYFNPNEPLTIQQAQDLLDRFDKKNKLKIKVTDETKNKSISYALWIDLYKSMLENVSGNKVKELFGIEEKEFIVLASPDNNTNLKNYNLISDQGAFSYEGLDVSYYIDKKIKALVKNNEIIAIIGISEENPTLKNAYVVKNTESEITIFSGGVERTFPITNESRDLKDKICDLQILEDSSEIKKVYEESISAKIKKVSDKSIELENLGIKNFTDDVKIYSAADNLVLWKNISDLVVGTDIAYYSLDNNLINAAVITKTPKPEKIRIAISDTGFKSLYHKNVEITSNEDFSVIKNNTTPNYKAKEIFKVNLAKNERILIKPKDENSKLIINSIKRNWPQNESPAYRGVLEISRDDINYLIINEIDLEEYLYAVVPSEMPTSYGLQACMVQAIAARSYAYNQFFENRFHEYGANIDDSVICQVYNNIPENETSISAVNQTKSICITYQNNVIAANFFSTSSGYTANSGEVWANSASKLFPSETNPYLIATKQFDGKDYGDLTVEENAIKFFKDTEINSYEKDSPWFRWNLEMSAKELSASINANLKDRYSANPTLIKTLQPDGFYRTKAVSDIGDVTNIQVIKRGAAGNVMQLKISGTKETIMVYTEYNIRMLIKPQSSEEKKIVINLQDGNFVENYSILPSSFFVFDKYVDQDGKLTRVIFYGGGNGHGVGMSQNGVKGMVDQGYDYEAIITHYFNGVELQKKI